LHFGILVKKIFGTVSAEENTELSEHALDWYCPEKDIRRDCIGVLVACGALAFMSLKSRKIVAVSLLELS
jgi:hypothetical protein